MPVHTTAKEAAEQFLRGLWILAWVHGHKRLVIKYGYGIDFQFVHEDATCLDVGTILFGQKESDPAVIDYGIWALRGFGSMNGGLPGAGRLLQICNGLEADQVFGKRAQAALAAIDSILEAETDVDEVGLDSNTEVDEQPASNDNGNGENDRANAPDTRPTGAAKSSGTLYRDLDFDSE